MEIVTTVSTEPKMELPPKEYGIPGGHTFYRRNTSFAKGTIEKTSQQGIDVVLNSLAGENPGTLRNIITLNDRFIELGRKYIEMNAGLSMRALEKGASFTAVEMSIVVMKEPRLMKEVIELLMHNMGKGAFFLSAPFIFYQYQNCKRACACFEKETLWGRLCSCMLTK